MTDRHHLIADSGSTKTDWSLGDKRYKTQGINPFHQTEKEIEVILQEELLPQIDGESLIERISFYGSGVRPELVSMMTSVLRRVFPSAAKVEAASDLLGAARALCGRQEGIACILGTGANSCLYDGSDILRNIPPMGYILGDEGSGAVLGIRLLNALYKERLPKYLLTLFENEMQLALPEVIARVYRQPMANRWLASLARFASAHLSDPAIEALVTDNFRSFIINNITPYQRPDLCIHAVGGIAYHFAAQLQKAAAEQGYTVGRILQSPIEGLSELD